MQSTEICVVSKLGGDGYIINADTVTCIIFNFDCRHNSVDFRIAYGNSTNIQDADVIASLTKRSGLREAVTCSR